ncbi:cyanate hydratase-like [Panonychus citri]|uniref:cyanate hydratase-like n=1 Tax=Panonychus citri TaxID=50023 RepID=UPI00230835DD|nr:cyanate hydratase-like [Panonychus citri]
MRITYKLLEKISSSISVNCGDVQIFTNHLLKAKNCKGLTYQQMATQLGVNKVWLTSILHGQNCCDIKLAGKICHLLDLPADLAIQLTTIPIRGNQFIENDPLVYRFNELVKVYGSSLRSIIHEEFGDGIMSAIDCKLNVSKTKESRILVTIDGKYLPYYKGS